LYEARKVFGYLAGKENYIKNKPLESIDFTGVSA